MKKVLLLSVFAGFLAGCSSLSVSRDYDTDADFSGLKTFAWKHAEQPETGDPRIDNDLNDERIRKAVNETLSAKGFQRTDLADADFLVAYFVEYKRKLNSGSLSLGFGGGSYGRFGGVGYNTGVSEYDQVGLTIDMIDPVNEKTIWRGVGSRAAYDGSSPEKTTKIVNESVSKILKKFPPK
ncbi:MAG: DUF4136 domain-containing protein [Verrucomicrobiota bacterium]